MRIIRLADEVARVSREQKVIIPSACYIVFDQEGIPESEQYDLCSAITSELGRRGGKKSGQVRRKKKGKSKQEIKNLLREAEEILAQEAWHQTLLQAYAVTMMRGDHLISDP